jgi:uncharacterized protein
MALEAVVTACITEEVWQEYEDVLFREKFAGVRMRAEGMLREFGAKAMRVRAVDPLSVASDEDDNRFLECAAAAEAEYLITGNLRHYPAEHWITRIVNARSFITPHAVPVVPAALE